MELFEEIYSTYFQVVRKILLEAANAPLSAKDMEQISKTYAFEESALTILPKLLEGSWSSLLTPIDDKRYGCALSSVKAKPFCSKKGCSQEMCWQESDSQETASLLKIPLTNLQKSWLRALLEDPRFRLFFTEEMLSQLNALLMEIPPLYSQEDFHCYDQYLDGDPYEDSAYRDHFQTILASICLRQPLYAAYESAKSKGRLRTLELLPCRLQYSAKDDKFRLLAVSLRNGRPGTPYTLNVNRILACHLSKTPVPAHFDWNQEIFGKKQASEPVRIRIGSQRNALERCMLHFASYEKHTEYEPSTGCYLCSIFYDPSDETELLIQLLSFGPVIEILGPEPFLAQVRQRVVRQHELFYSDIPG